MVGQLDSELTPPRRMKTRSTNANAHPGMRAKEALRVRAPARPQDQIEEEKSAKAAAKEAKAASQAAARALKEAGEQYVAQLQANKQATAKIRESEIPRRRTKKVEESHTPGNSVMNKRKNPEVEDNSGADASSVPPQEAKKAKLFASKPRVQEKHLSETLIVKNTRYAQGTATNKEAVNPAPKHQLKTGPVKKLRRHETEINLDDLAHKSAKDDRQIYRANGINSTEPNDDDHDATPRQISHVKEDLRAVDNFSSDADDDFSTPRTLKKLHKGKAIMIVNDSASELESYKLDEAGMRKADRSKQAEQQVNGTAKNVGSSGKRINPKATVHVNLAAYAKGYRAMNSKVIAPQHGTKNHPRPEPRPTNPQLAQEHNKRNRISSQVHATSTAASHARSTQPAIQSHVAHVMANIIPRKTSSNPTITSKNSMSEKRNKATRPELKSEHESEHEPKPEPELDSTRNNAIGGLGDDEDDALEEEVAMSSPMKGAEARGASKLLIKNKRKGIEGLPLGANDNDAWRSNVVPNFIGLLLGGDVPWKITDGMIEETLANVCKRTYGERVKIDIKRGSLAFDLIVQALTNYRSKFATSALPTVLTHLAWLLDIEDLNLSNDGPALAELACCENLGKMKETGRFENTMILNVFAVHFGRYTLGRELKGLKIKRPNCGLALAAAAVERALELILKEQINQTVTAKGKKKYGIIPTVNPLTGKPSTTATDFSTDNWNDRTIIMLKNIQKLDDKRFLLIFNIASNLTNRRNHIERGNISQLQNEDIIESEDESDNDNQVDNDTEMTGYWGNNGEHDDNAVAYEEDSMDYE